MTWKDRIKRRLIARFERLLREADGGLGFWGWLAIIVAGVSGIGIATGLVLTAEKFENIGVSLVSVSVGIVLLALTSPGWGATAAIRRHRRRLAARIQAFGPKRELADQLYATDRVPANIYQRQCGLMDHFLAGTGPGDAARVAASWARIVGAMVFVSSVPAALFSWAASHQASTTVESSNVEPLLAVASTSGILGIILAIMAIGLLSIAAGLGAAATRQHQEHDEAIMAGHAQLLEAARTA